MKIMQPERPPYKLEAKERARMNPGTSLFYENTTINGEKRKVYLTYSELGGRYFNTYDTNQTVCFLGETVVNDYGESSYEIIGRPIPLKVYFEIMNKYLDRNEHWSKRIDAILTIGDDDIESVQMMASIGEPK